MKKTLKRRSGPGNGVAQDASLADILQALSDPVRLHIVRLAAARELACCEFGLDLPKATLSHHFKVLRHAGVIAVRAEGTRHITTLNRKAMDARFPGLMKSILAARMEGD